MSSYFLFQFSFQNWNLVCKIVGTWNGKINESRVNSIIALRGCFVLSPSKWWSFSTLFCVAIVLSIFLDVGSIPQAATVRNWRFTGILGSPTKRCSNPGGDGYWMRAEVNIYYAFFYFVFLQTNGLSTSMVRCFFKDCGCFGCPNTLNFQFQILAMTSLTSEDGNPEMLLRC